GGACPGRAATVHTPERPERRPLPEPAAHLRTGEGALHRASAARGHCGRAPERGRRAADPGLGAARGMGEPARGRRHQPRYHGGGLPSQALPVSAHRRWASRRAGDRVLRGSHRPARPATVGGPGRYPRVASFAQGHGSQPDPDPAKTHLLLLSLAERFSSLADNAQAFMSALRRAIDFSDGDVDGFLAYKERLIDYINKFIADLANS